MTEKQEKATAAGNGGRSAGSDIEREVAALKEDLVRLSDHVTGLFTAVGDETVRTARAGTRRAKRKYNNLATEVGDMSREAADVARDAGDDAVHAMEDAIHERPLTTLAMAIGVGFLLGAAWRK
jgi:ElaB/YqjD/DUF883 family membrane-anchored ribosome-binding protein